MSLCRRRAGVSEVYMFEHVEGGIACSACLLHPTERWWATVTFHNTQAAIAHVREHIKAGHLVPDHLIPAIQETNP